MKGLKTAILKERGSALHLFSEIHTHVFVTGFPSLPDDQLEENHENLPILVLKRRASTWYAEPDERPTQGNYGWFSSGNSLDLKIDGHHQVMIYDRQETPAEYTFFSN